MKRCPVCYAVLTDDGYCYHCSEYRVGIEIFDKPKEWERGYFGYASGMIKHRKKGENDGY